ncbi:MAG: hypothetical protein N2Z21_08025 [Candidatus Sumerlaeaceae bacterium]|nr:hypothetical protein [Candidatus Sumerlaeaceae bacterium]
MDREAFLKIAKPQPTCVLCGAALTQAGRHPSVLVASEDPGADSDLDLPRREDYCVQCWEQQRAKDYVGFWLTKREPPQPRKVQNRRERNARLAAYFDYFYREDPQAHAPRLFFLSHLLMRYGVLKWRRTDIDPATGRERVYYHHLINDEEVVVDGVELSDDELVAIKREVDELLAGTLGLEKRLESESSPENESARDAQSPQSES